MLIDIAEKFDNLKRINMKLNPKKCSFGVEEGKLLGYMVTSEENSLPFFETLKDITKENKHDYRWTEKAENAFQELNKMILDLPALATPLPKETLFVYLAASKEAVRAILKRWHWPYDTHPGGQIPADFINEMPVGREAMVPQQTQYTIDHQKDYKEELVLYTYGESSAKGLGAGLVLISPTKTEYTYALRLNFESTNIEAEYEALLARLRIAKKIGVQSLSVNVDSKLVASQTNGNYKACKENMIRIQRLPSGTDGRRGRGKTAFYTDQDIAETFDNLRRINMKLNPKKCSFGVEEGKFLGYIVTSEGIRANPVKTKDIAEMQSPRTWGEIQSLAGKLAVLNRFIFRSTKNSLPFFKTLKDITKENKYDCRWTKKVENAFQELKKMILNLSALATPSSKETLFVYLAASKEAVSAILLVVRQGKKHLVHYVSRTLHDAERNYATLEKMALALRHASGRLRRYFKAYPITVITYQPIKQILNGASSAKGSDVGLVLISITKTEYTYALRLNFESINNQAEYEALLVGLRIAKKIGVQSLSVNVDSKLVASQINDNYEACKENVIWYLNKAKEYIGCFTNFRIQNIPWNKNQKADVLSKLALVEFNHLTTKILVETLVVSSMDVEEINVVVEEEAKIWMTPIINCLERGIWSEDENEAYEDKSICHGRRGYIQKILPNAYASGMDVLGPLPEAPGKEGNDNEKEMRLNLDLLTEKREAAAIQEARYKMKMEHYYNKRVCPMSFKVGEYVYRKNKASRVENLGKLGPKWEGPYFIVEAYQNGSYKLRIMDDRESGRSPC
nr:reverse transcriptase domain-containing protein [Tanacetum cinerariifolium]